MQHDMKSPRMASFSKYLILLCTILCTAFLMTAAFSRAGAEQNSGAPMLTCDDVSCRAVTTEQEPRLYIFTEQEQPSTTQSGIAQSRQPVAITFPEEAQVFVGLPVTIEICIMHEAERTLNYEFWLFSAIHHKWEPQSIVLQNLRTVEETSGNGITPVLVTSGNITIKREGKWRLHAWCDYPFSSLSGSTTFLVKGDTETITTPRSFHHRGLIKVK